jgi:glycosyltransferase involved in cell wall biosynthesis
MARISLVTTVLNEEQTITHLLASIAEQTVQPDEVIIVDGGSTDGTVALIESFSQGSGPIRLIVAPGNNRSQGRNLACEAAEGEIVAVTDGGVRLHPEWLARITRPLVTDPAVDVVSGYYVNEAASFFERCVGAFTRWSAAELDDTFLPSSRSLAMRKKAWQAVQGYPAQFRWNEDTVFDLKLLRSGARFVLAKDALVYHRPSSTLRALYIQYLRFGRGDGQAGIRPLVYLARYILPYIVGLALLFLGFWNPLSWALLAVLLIAYLGRTFLRAYRRWPDARLFVLGLPILFTLDLAKVLGWTWGTLERLWHPEYRHW